MSGEPDQSELLVLCSESDLQEYGEVVRLGEQVSREAGRREVAFYGGHLDEVEWQFDQYARVVGYEAATITGRVTAIRAVYVDLTRQPDGWTPRPGSVHLEQIQSTADTRSVEDEIAWGTPSPPDEDGYSYAVGHTVIREGDEHLTGWLFTMRAASITPLPRAET